MYEVFLDTETTGLSYGDGHKIVEIACIETKDLIPTGNIFHKIINPKRSMPEAAFNVHGFSEEYLKDTETFDKVVDEFEVFIKEKDPLKLFPFRMWGHYNEDGYQKIGKQIYTKITEVSGDERRRRGRHLLDTVYALGSSEPMCDILNKFFKKFE